MGKIMLSKYGHLMLPSGIFPDKVTPRIGFTGSSCKNTSVGAGNLQMITNKF